MRIPFFQRKKLAPNADLPRTAAGTFAPRTPVQPIDVAVEKETKAISNVVELIGAVRKMGAEEDERINSKVAAALEAYGEEDLEPDGLNQWTPIIQAILPYLPGIMQKIGVAPTSEPPPSAAPPSPSPPTDAPAPAAQENLAVWISRASEASPKLIKPVLPMLHAKIKESGIEPEVFKRAVINIARAYGEKNVSD